MSGGAPAAVGYGASRRSAWCVYEQRAEKPLNSGDGKDKEQNEEIRNIARKGLGRKNPRRDTKASDQNIKGEAARQFYTEDIN